MQSETLLARPPGRPLLLYDGACGLCVRWVEWARRLTAEAIAYEPFQTADVAGRFPELSLAELERRVHLLTPEGGVCRGAEAILRALAENGVATGLWRQYETVPAFAEASEAAYQWIVEHREWLLRTWVWFEPVAG